MSGHFEECEEWEWGGRVEGGEGGGGRGEGGEEGGGGRREGRPSFVPTSAEPRL